jgi:flagellar FliJ protein
MSAFRWRLDRVLQVRGLERERARAALVLARTGLEAAAARVRDAQDALAAAGGSVAASLDAGVSALQLRAMHRSVESLRVETQRRVQLERDAEARFADTRAALVAARSRERSLEILRSRALVLHRTESARREQEALDEIAVARFARKAR